MHGKNGSIAYLTALLIGNKRDFKCDDSLYE
jgi:hypothetical protein